MQFRLWLVAVVLWCAAAATAHADVRSTTVEYKSGSGGTGYDSASFSARYALHACQGSLVITTEFVRGSFRWSGTYWLDGSSYPAPGGLSPTVDDQGEFNGSVRVRGGGTIGSFRSTAGVQSGHGCLGDTSNVADLRRFVDPKDKNAVERFLGSLEVIPDTNPAYRNVNIESAIRHKLEQDQREAKKKEEEEVKRKADEAARKAQDEERAKKAAEEAKAKEDDEARKGAEDATTQDEQAAQKQKDDDAQKAAAREKARADDARQADEHEAKRKAENDAAAARTVWTEADERDADEGYWPDSRCSWVDDQGFVHPPRGRHRCDPEYMKKVYASMKRQRELQEAMLEAERKRKAKRDAIETLSGGTREGVLVVGTAAALAPLVDVAGDALNRLDEHFPKTIDLEATGRVLSDGGTGYGFSMRAPGVFYTHVGFASFDSGEWDRIVAASFGLGFQLPLTRAFTIRAFEVGLNIGSARHHDVVSTIALGVNMRVGGVYRLIGGLSFSAMLGIDSTEKVNAFVDVGVLWRFDLGNNKRYMIR
jgi:hypothetical protein